ncbi:hypothetical protein M0C34_13520 [Agarivorans sp. TSD2052]|uniref:hypothetical protein n=1 Tax=Agarivorans sp. TSD2052 TaxID=2937286 RepID=UPI00200C48A1|nr:hypothetical protein [Agarivorans sp. TSD2052]UPW17259.1 hypothetical protein M0C34_13520 [Agarivorans sp. TSD2052]
MTMPMEVLSQSLSLLEDWQQQSVTQRAQLLERWAQRIVKRAEHFAASASMIRFQCQQASRIIAKQHQLQGPTGETNELYCVGRGTFLIHADETANTVAIAGLISAALVAGNTIICSVAPSAKADLDILLCELLRAGCPDRVAIQLDADASEQLAMQPQLAGIALAASQTTCQHYNQLLAERDGQLAQLVYETDLLNFAHLSEATFCLRFITERTRTINITAVGGNASLLELGSGD